MQQNNTSSENEKTTQQQKAQAPFSNLNMHILFLSDLPNSVTEDDLKLFFKDYSDKIKLISINPSKVNPVNKKLKSPTATIIFSDSKSSEVAKKNLNLRKIKGRSVRIMWHTKDKNIIENPHTNIYVKNIPELVTPRDVLEHFSQFGEIVSAKIPENEEGNHFGFGYINYLDVEAAKKAIESENGKRVWNSDLEVQPFIEMKARANTLISNNSSTLYLKDFPDNFNEKNIIEICRNFGEIQSCRIISDKAKAPFAQAYAVLIFPNAETAESVKNALNNMQIEGKFLKAENYKTKEEKIASAAAADNSNSLPNYNAYLSNVNTSTNNYLPKGLGAAASGNNNLHVKNIPFEATEADLISCFSKFGEIKSAKIEKMNLVTKVNDEYKEIPTSQGFGYVCFSKPEDAQKAKEAMDGKYLPKFEMWKRPLLIDFFVPKSQRKNVHTGLAGRTEAFYGNEGYGSNPYFAQGYMGNMPMQPNKMNIYSSPQQKFMDNNVNTGFYPQAQNKDVFNMQQMYQNFPNAAAPQMPYSAQANRNYSMNQPVQGANNMGQYGRGQNQQFYQKPMYPMQNAFPNQNQNMTYNQRPNQYAQQHLNYMSNPNPNQNFGNPIMNKFTQNQNQLAANKQNLNIPQQQQQQQPSTQNQTQTSEEKSDVDLEYLNSLEDVEAKKEFLGEIIFKKIENHPLAQKYEFSINKIGKTTGMILAIDDINYITDICRNDDNLTAYINEAHELLKESEH